MKNKIENAVKVMNGNSINEYLQKVGLRVYSTTDLGDNEGGCLFADKILVRKNLERNYRRFIVLHEVGHYIMHKNDSLAFSYSYLGHRNKIEDEANMFACMKLIEGIDLAQIDILDLLQRKGVPLKIAIRFIELYK